MFMNFAITVLGSGSRGNAILVHNEKNAILVDAGFSRKALLEKISVLGIDPRIIRALLISHEHGDHVDGVRLFSDELGIPAYLTMKTAASLEESGKLGKKRERNLFSPEELSRTICVRFPGPGKNLGSVLPTGGGRTRESICVGDACRFIATRRRE